MDFPVLCFVELGVPLQTSQHRKEMDLLEWDQRKPTQIIGEMEHLSWKERLRELGDELFSRVYCNIAIVNGLN